MKIELLATIDHGPPTGDYGHASVVGHRSCNKAKRDQRLTVTA